MECGEQRTAWEQGAGRDHRSLCTGARLKPSQWNSVFLDKTCVFPPNALRLGPVWLLDLPLWFPSVAQKKMKDKDKHMATLGHVMSLFPVFCDGLLDNLANFRWVSGKLTYDKFYIEKRKIYTHTHTKWWCQTGQLFRKVLVLVFLKVHTKFQIICHVKFYAGIIFLIPNRMCHWANMKY